MRERTVPGGSVVNHVNARLTAPEPGVEVEETAHEDAGDQSGVIEVALDSDGAACARRLRRPARAAPHRPGRRRLAART